MLFMTLYAFRIISVHKTLNFMHFLQKRDIRTDRPTDRRTDTPSYRDARTHLKIFTNSQCHSYLPEVVLANTANTTSPRIIDFIFLVLLLMKEVVLFPLESHYMYELRFETKYDWSRFSMIWWFTFDICSGLNIHSMEFFPLKSGF